MQLMFGAARFWRPGLSASRSKGFRITPHGIGAEPRRLMRLKCFRQRWIFGAAMPLASPCGLSASRGALFRLACALRGRELPSVCRNAPEVCRNTRKFRRRPPAQLKRFNRRQDSSSAKLPPPGRSPCRLIPDRMATPSGNDSSTGKCSRPSRAVFPFLRAVIHFNRQRCAATTSTFPVRGQPLRTGFSLRQLFIKFCPNREFFPTLRAKFPIRRCCFLFA